MKYWKQVDIGDFTKWIEKVNSYFNTVYHTRPRHELLKYNTFWNPVSPEDIDLYFPELVESTSKFGEINEVSILLLSWDSSSLHIDHTIGKNKDKMARLNIPILNCEGSHTAFFELSPEVFNTHQSTRGGSKSWSSELRNTLTPVTSIELIQPTILRTSNPHTVFCKTNKFPRISLTVSFKDDIVRFLDE